MGKLPPHCATNSVTCIEFPPDLGYNYKGRIFFRAKSSKGKYNMKLSVKTCLKAGLTVFLTYLCITYWQPLVGIVGKLLGAASPLIIGFFIAYILNILMSFYERIPLPRSSVGKSTSAARRIICMILAFLTLVGVAALVIGLVIPELISCVSFLISEIPPAIEKFIGSDFVRDHLPEDWLAQLASVNWQEHLQNIAGIVASGIGGVAGIVIKTLSSVFSVLVTAFISIIFAIYLLLGRDRLSSQLKRIMAVFLPRKVNSRVFYVARIVNDCFKRYIVGQCTEAVILGCLCVVGMLIFRFPYAAMIGALIGFTALIPIAGAYIGAAVGALMILTESPVKAVLFIVFIIVLQQLEGNIIYPRVVGKSIGLPGLWVLAAVTVGGGLFGIFGMLIGVPITASLYRLLGREIRKRERLDKFESELQRTGERNISKETAK